MAAPGNPNPAADAIPAVTATAVTRLHPLRGLPPASIPGWYGLCGNGTERM